MKNRKKILVLDDDELVRELLQDVLESNPALQVSSTDRYQEALRLCENEEYDLLMLDHNLREGIGWTLADLIKQDPEKYGNPQIALMSGTVPEDEMKIKKKFRDKVVFFRKPFDVEELLEMVSLMLNTD